MTEAMEACMRKLPHFATAIAFAVLVVMFLMRISTPTTGEQKRSPTISVEDLHRSIDLSALPVQQVNEPF
jgi:hypothetical protein